MTCKYVFLAQQTRGKIPPSCVEDAEEFSKVLKVTPVRPLRETAGHTRSCPIGTTSRAESIRASELNELGMRRGGGGGLEQQQEEEEKQS